MRAALPLATVQSPLLHSPEPMATGAAGWAADFMTMHMDQGAVQKQAMGLNGSGGLAQIQPNHVDVAANGHLHSPSPLMQSTGLSIICICFSK
jgi:peroxin-5